MPWILGLALAGCVAVGERGRPPEPPPVAASLQPAPERVPEAGPCPLDREVLSEAEAKDDACMVCCNPHPPKLIWPSPDSFKRRVSENCPALAGDCMVIVEAIVDVEGCVAWAKVLRGLPVLHEEATREVLGWRFTPALTRDKLEPVKCLQTFTMLYASPSRRESK